MREREWLGEWELRSRPDWSGSIQYRDNRGWMTSEHRPDLIGSGNPVEVELTRKAPGRLDAILRLYDSWQRDGRIAGVLYVVDSDASRNRVLSAADRIGLPVRIVPVADVVSETRSVAEVRRRSRVAA